MNKLKFRAWNTTTNTWYKPVFDASNGNLHELMISFKGDLLAHTIEGIEHESVFKDQYIINQYIGYPDKNGKEIYEGDIINITNYSYNNSEGKREESIERQTINDMRDYFQYKGYSEIELCELWDSENLEIIGNIYENPELLITKT